MVLIRISLMANNVEYIFICSFVVYIFSLVKCLFMSSAIFFKKIEAGSQWLSPWAQPVLSASGSRRDLVSAAPGGWVRQGP